MDVVTDRENWSEDKREASPPKQSGIRRRSERSASKTRSAAHPIRSILDPSERVAEPQVESVPHPEQPGQKPVQARAVTALQPRWEPLQTADYPKTTIRISFRCFRATARRSATRRPPSFRWQNIQSAPDR